MYGWPKLVFFETSLFCGGRGLEVMFPDASAWIWLGIAVLAAGLGIVWPWEPNAGGDWWFRGDGKWIPRMRSWSLMYPEGLRDFAEFCFTMAATFLGILLALAGIGWIVRGLWQLVQ